MAEVVELEVVEDLMVQRVRAVLAVDGEVSLDARFVEDLRADSLDIVEVVEGVERLLAERGVDVELPVEELMGLRTLRDAAERIHGTAR